MEPVVTDYSEFVRTVHFIEQSAPAGDGPPILCTSTVRLDDGPAITYHGAWSVSSDGIGHGVIITVTADPQDLQVTESESDFPRWLRVRWHGRSLLTPIGEAAIAELLTETSRAPVALRFYAAEIRVETERPTSVGAGSIEDLIEASSLGTPEAKAARARVSMNEARAVVDRAAALSGRTRPVNFTKLVRSGQDPVVSCYTCAAVVVDESAHAAWHAAQPHEYVPAPPAVGLMLTCITCGLAQYTPVHLGVPQ
jgi:hypothetical protein